MIYPIPHEIYEEEVANLVNRDFFFVTKNFLELRKIIAEENLKPATSLTSLDDGVYYLMIETDGKKIPVALVKSCIYLRRLKSLYNSTDIESVCGIYVEKKYAPYIEKIREIIKNPQEYCMGSWYLVKTSDKPDYYTHNTTHRIRAAEYNSGNCTYSPNIELGNYEITDSKNTIAFTVDNRDSYGDTRILFPEMKEDVVDVKKIHDKINFIISILNFNPRINHA